MRGRPGRSVTSTPHKCFSVRMFRDGFRQWWEKGTENKLVLFWHHRFLTFRQKTRVSWRKKIPITSKITLKILKHCMKNGVYSYICGRISSAENDVTPGLSPPISFFFFSHFCGNVGVLSVQREDGKPLRERRPQAWSHKSHVLEKVTARQMLRESCFLTQPHTVSDTASCCEGSWQARTMARLAPFSKSMICK